jgi:hypothetical protein
MQREPSAASARWPSLAFIAGGTLVIGLWLIFTNVHGPTSYNLDRPFLGRGTTFWGMLLGGPPSLLVAAGLLGHGPRLTQVAPRRARIGLGLAALRLAVSGALELVVGALNTPSFLFLSFIVGSLLMPVIGVGVLMIALGRPASPALPRAAITALVIIGALDLVAFALVMGPLDTSDAIGGYRLYGLLAHVGTGLGWVAAGLALWPLPAPLSRPART